MRSECVLRDPISWQVRAIVEGQFLSMRMHAERIGMPCPPERVIATGGGSANRQMLALIASIFGCDVYTAQRPGKLSPKLCTYLLIEVLVVIMAIMAKFARCSGMLQKLRTLGLCSCMPKTY